MPRKLSPVDRAKRAAADAALMRSERLLDGKPDNIRKLLQEIHDHQYQLVDKQLDAMLGKASRDPAYDLVERDLSNFFDSDYGTSDGLNRDQVDAWVKASPDSAWALYAHASLLNDQAQQARGEHFADQVTDDQWKLMQQYDAQARDELSLVLKLNPKIVWAWVRLLDIDRATDARPEQQYGDFMLARNQRPRSVILPEAYMEGLEPRWGGSYEKMDKVAVDAAKHRGVNSRFWGLLGMTSADAGYGAVDEHCTPCDEAAWEGSLKDYNSALGYEDRWTWLDRAGYAAIHLGRYALAYKYFERALAYRPDNAEFQVGVSLMSELCSSQPDLAKLDNLRQTYNAVTGSDIDDLPRGSGDCTFYKAELPWGDEPVPSRAGIVAYQIQ